ncbi:MAG: peptidoglycan DD-metalloendopeptidase family protein [Pseudomonadota bacterium]
MNLRTLSVLLLLACPLAAGANQAASKQSELDALKKRLQALEQDFRNKQATRKEAVDELRESERAISAAVRQLRQLESEQQRSQGELLSLKQQSDAVAARIRDQQAHLAEALKGVYLRGQGDALKLFLNGGDPNQTARDMRYLAHLSRAQHQLIDALRADLARLDALQRQVAQQSDALRQLQAAREAEQKKLQAERQSREQVLQKLSAEIRQQQRQIATLKRDEQNLTLLVERLNRVMAQQAARARAAQQAKQAKQKEAGAARPRAPVAVNTETPVPFRSDQPFSRLKGSLRLPVAGELVNRFGAPRENGGVSWRGLFIRAAQGAPVKAIAAGQVVFAEWLRGFGNLIIVDHGESYMSLYSNNESLYKQVGDRVQPGDTLAAVGNSGGQPDTGLYFEMRHQSRPINPLEWVK